MGAESSSFRTLLFFAVSSAVTFETLFVSAKIPNTFAVSKTVVILAFAAVIVPLLAVCVSSRDLRPYSWRPLLLLFSLQIGAYALATLFSTSISVSFWGGDWRRMGLLTCFAVMVIAASVPFAIAGSERRFISFLRVIVVTGFVSGMFGILQWFGIDPLLPQSLRDQLTVEFGGVYRPPGTIGQAVYYASYLLYPIFAGLTLILIDRRSLWRWIGATMVLTGIMGVVISQARSAFLGLGAGFVAVGAIEFASRKRLTWRSVGITAVFLIGILALTLLTGFSDRLTSDPTGSGSLRLFLWRDIAQHILPEVWLQGAGLGMFRSVYSRLRSGVYNGANPDVHFETPHNLFLDRWVEQGLPGLLVLIASIAAFAMLLWRAHRLSQRTEHKRLVAPIAGAFTAALTAGLFNGEVLSTTFYFYLWIGVAFALCDISRGTPRATWISFSRPMAFSIALALPISGLLAWHAYRNWTAEIQLGRAMAYATRGDFRLFVTHAKASSDAFPHAGTYDLAISQFVSNLTKVPGALGNAARRDLVGMGIDHGLHAVEHNDQSMLALYSISELGLLSGDPRTETWLRNLINIDPHWYRPHWLLAVLLLRQEKVSEAQKHAEIAYRLAPYVEAVVKLRHAAAFPGESQ